MMTRSVIHDEGAMAAAVEALLLNLYASANDTPKPLTILPIHPPSPPDKRIEAACESHNQRLSPCSVAKMGEMAFVIL